MDGMTMMMRSLGIDPEAIKGQIVQFQSGITQSLAHFEERFRVQQDLLETQSKLIALQTEALRVMSDRLDAFCGKGTAATVLRPVIEEHINGLSRDGD